MIGYPSTSRRNWTTLVWNAIWKRKNKLLVTLKLRNFNLNRIKFFVATTKHILSLLSFLFLRSMLLASKHKFRGKSWKLLELPKKVNLVFFWKKEKKETKFDSGYLELLLRLCRKKGFPKNKLQTWTKRTEEWINTAEWYGKAFQFLQDSHPYKYQCLSGRLVVRLKKNKQEFNEMLRISAVSTTCHYLKVLALLKNEKLQSTFISFHFIKRFVVWPVTPDMSRSTFHY